MVKQENAPVKLVKINNNEKNFSKFEVVVAFFPKQSDPKPQPPINIESTNVDAVTVEPNRFEMALKRFISKTKKQKPVIKTAISRSAEFLFSFDIRDILIREKTKKNGFLC